MERTSQTGNESSSPHRGRAGFTETLWVKVRRGSSVGVVAQAGYLVSRFLLTPVIVAQAGLDAYGFWSILFVMLGLMGIHRMGILSASVAHASAQLAAGHPARASEVLRTTASIAALLAIPAGAALVLGAEAAAGLIGVAPENLDAATTCVQITGLATLIALVFGGWQSALEARQEHARVKVTDSIAQLLEGAVLVFLLYADTGLLGLAVAYAARVLIPIPIHRFGALRGGTPLVASPGKIHLPDLMPLLRLGGAIQLLGAVHLAIAAVPRLALAHGGGLMAAGAYEVARKLVEFAAALPTHGLAPFAPASAALGARGAPGRRDLMTALQTATSVVALAGAIPTVLFMVSAEDLVLAWLGHGDARIVIVLRVLAPAAWLHLTTGALTSALRGLAKPRAELAYAICWLALSAVLVPVAQAHAGLIGVAGAVAVTQAACCVGLWTLAPLAADLSPSARLRSIFLPALGPVLAGALIVLAGQELGPAVSRGDAILRVLAAGGLITAGAAPWILSALTRFRVSQPLTA